CGNNLEIAANKKNFHRQKWFCDWISIETRARSHESAKRRGILNVQGQTAIVTGGGSGLGAATARALAEKGAKVALCDINLEAAKKVAGEIGGLALSCNVS